MHSVFTWWGRDGEYWVLGRCFGGSLNSLALIVIDLFEQYGRRIQVKVRRGNRRTRFNYRAEVSLRLLFRGLRSHEHEIWSAGVEAKSPGFSLLVSQFWVSTTGFRSHFFCALLVTCEAGNNGGWETDRCVYFRTTDAYIRPHCCLALKPTLLHSQSLFLPIAFIH